jgi:cell division protein FtsW
MLYLFLFYRGVKIAKNARDNFGKLLAVGIVTWIMVQTILNIGGMINFIPMTGVPLPLISYGGSAMLATLAALGILVNISKQTVNN